MTPECKPSVTRTKTFCREQKARKILLSAYLSEARNLAQNGPLWRLVSLHSATHSYSVLGATPFQTLLAVWQCPHSTVCGAGSMTRNDVRPSTVRVPAPARATAANSVAVARPAGDIDRLLHGAQHAARCATGECGQCHVVSVVADQTC